MTSSNSDSQKRMYYEANRDRILAASKARYVKNRAKIIAQGRTWYANNRERVAETSRARYQRKRGEIIAKVQAYSTAHPEKARARKLKSAYDLSAYAHEVLLLTQSSCPVCGRQFEKADRQTGRQPVVHHNHNTGQIIGIWCSRCNIGSGQFADDPSLLLAAAELNSAPA